jgi:hypothetical protein
MAEWHKTKRHAIELQAQIAYLSSNQCLPDLARHWDAVPAQDAVHLTKLKAAVQPWESAIAALGTDADAPLP